MSRNIVKDYIDFDKKCLKNYIDIVAKKNLSEKISDLIVKTYVDVRYYDIYEQVLESPIENIEYYIKKSCDTYLEGKKNKEEVDKGVVSVCTIIKYFLFVEKIGNDKSLLILSKNLEKNIRESLKLRAPTADKLFDLINFNIGEKHKFIKGLSSNEFKVTDKILNIPNILYLEFENSVKIPDLFSQVAINRVYNNGVIALDKLYVYYTMACSRILNDVIHFECKKKYLVDFDVNLLAKKTKMQSLFKIIDYDLIKMRLVFKISMEEYLENKEEIDVLIHQGYLFAVIINDTFDGSIAVLDIFEYIILDGQIENIPKLNDEKERVIFKELVGE